MELAKSGGGEEGEDGMGLEPCIKESMSMMAPNFVVMDASVLVCI